MPTPCRWSLGLILGSTLGACSVSSTKLRAEGTAQARVPAAAQPTPAPRLSAEVKGGPEAAAASAAPLVGERPSPGPLGSSPSPAPSGPAPLASASLVPSPQVQAEPTATPHLVVLAAPQGLRAFPKREASGGVFDCAFDPPTAIATWRVQPSAASLRWTRFALSAQVEGQAPATAPWHLGPGALGLEASLEGPAELRLPLRIPILAEAIASAGLGQRVRFRLEAEASGAQAPPTGPEGQAWFVDGSVEVL